MPYEKLDWGGGALDSCFQPFFSHENLAAAPKITPACAACKHSLIQSGDGGQQLLQIARTAVRTYFNLEQVKKRNENKMNEGY